MNDIPCFLLEPTSQVRHWLRRFRGGTDYTCPGPLNYHNAEVHLDDTEADKVVSDDSWPHDDPRWPKACPCGYQFQDDDRWQLSCERLYRRPDTGALTTINEAPPGAMWFADWITESRPKPVVDQPGDDFGPDGRCLMVKCPGGTWNVDGKSSNGSGWTRTGTPPNVTARPSIFIDMPNGWHGFLTEGRLVPC